MRLSPNYLKDKICLNVLANSVENAKECYEAAEGHIVLGVLSKNFSDDETAIVEMKKYQQATNNALSIGLGAGDPNQSQMVTRLAEVLQPQHVNQVFTGVGASRAVLKQTETVINGLVSPTGKEGYVNIATGPLSSQGPAGVVTLETAIRLLKDMGGSSIKEYKALAEACAANDFYLEPTGGIDLDNVEEIVRIAIDAGVKKVIPHVYSAIIDKDTGNTRPEEVRQLLQLMKKIVE